MFDLKDLLFWLLLGSEECNKDVPVALISMHSCSLEAKIKMNLDCQVVEAAEVKKPERKRPKTKDPNAKRAKEQEGPNKSDEEAPEVEKLTDEEYKLHIGARQT
ncbi:hypothetical protein TanjilG_03730 [Lupinus angustifolius]|uniref:Uncharacterized protein n=1 Tax=Lupinus angustifolius TaxID=3871 RepID=A0A1J7I1X9_LUPAN|nr:hypothetical protein TanjilG_03730 [Lupinus angustifolius]